MYTFNFISKFYLLGFGGSRGAFLVPGASWTPSTLFFSILGDFELPNVGLGTRKLGLGSIVFVDLTPFATVGWFDDVVIRWEFFFFSIPVCKFAFGWTGAEEEEENILSIKLKW